MTDTMQQPARTMRPVASVGILWLPPHPVVQLPVASCRKAVAIAERLLTPENAALMSAVEVRAAGSLVALWKVDAKARCWRSIPVVTP